MWWVSQCSNSTQCRTIGLVPKLSNCSPNGLWTRVSFQIWFRNVFICVSGATQTGQFVVDCEVHQSVTQAPNLPPKNLWVFVQNQMITKPIYDINNEYIIHLLYCVLQIHPAQLWVPCHCVLHPRGQREDGDLDLGHTLWPADAEVDQRVQEEDNCWE